MIQTRPSLLAVLAIAILFSGCDRFQSRETAEADQHAVQIALDSHKHDAANQPAASRQIDPMPKLATTSKVVKQMNVKVAGESACSLIVRYVGSQDQPVTWRKEECGSISLKFVTLGDLTSLGQEAKLDGDAREDVSQLPDHRTLYIEGKFSSAIYPINAAGHIYRVNLAD
jgi:hypothetical protein